MSLMKRSAVIVSNYTTQKKKGIQLQVGCVLNERYQNMSLKNVTIILKFKHLYVNAVYFIH